MGYKEFNCAMMCMIMITGCFVYQSTIMNPMLNEIHHIEPETSSLFFTIGAVTFLVGTPVAFQLMKRKIATRRTIIFTGLVLMGLGLVFRTGNMRGTDVIHFVYTC